MAQLDLFGRSQLPPPVSQRPDLKKIRMILGAALRELRAAEEMPWQTAQLRSWHLVFQNMTKWLPADERDEYCREFAIEMSRLHRTSTMFSGK